MRSIPDKFSIIGAGRMGIGFGLCLKEAGLKPAYIWSRSPKSIERALDLLGGGIPAEDIYTGTSQSDLVIIGVPDDAIFSVVEKASQKKAIKQNSIWIHLSGFHGLDPLRKIKEYDAVPLGIHPLQTVPDPALALERLKGIKFTIVSEEKDYYLAEKIIKRIGGIPVRIDEDKRPLYHAAAVVACNDFVGLFHVSSELLNIASSGKLTFKDLLPLVKATLDGIEQFGPEKALTGPVVRGDKNVIKGHINAIKKHAPWFIDVYKVLGKETVRIATKLGKDLKSISDMLK